MGKACVIAGLFYAFICPRKKYMRIQNPKLIHDVVCRLTFLYVLLFAKIGIDDYTAIGVSTHYGVC